MELFVGLMSGTSMDAVDAVLADLAPPVPRLIATRSEPFDDALRSRLEAAARQALSPVALWALDAHLGERFAAATTALLARARTDPAAVSGIGCHGQTVFHDPDGDPPCTVQLGDPSRIAERTGITTVADFRRRDVAAGGQGAPLAPIFHAAFFTHPARARVVLNLGGIANVTVLPAGRAAGEVRGFDTGPANTLLDAWAREHLGQPFDRDGAWAATGRVDRELLAHLLSDPYFDRAPPKSTGRERFNRAWLGRHLEATAAGGAAPAAADVARTLCELTARSVASAVARHAAQAEEVLVCGGGARNRLLVRRLAASLAPRPVASTGRAGLDPRWVEATGFAWLARETLAGRPGNLPSVTGARRAVVLGGIYRR